MLEKWKEKFIASQDAKTLAARKKLMETQMQEREAELELVQASSEYQKVLTSGPQRLAEAKTRGDAEIRAKKEAIKKGQEADEAKIQRLREEIAVLDEQLKAYKK